MLPSSEEEILRGIQGQRLTLVRRQVLVSDYEQLSPDVRDEESDGPVELRFSNGVVINVAPNTEKASVIVEPGEMPRWGDCYRLLDPSGNAFWAGRLGQEVVHLNVLVSRWATEENPSEFGLEVVLGNGYRFVIEYLSDEEHPDLVRVCEGANGQYVRQVIF